MAIPPVTTRSSEAGLEGQKIKKNLANPVPSAVSQTTLTSLLLVREAPSRTICEHIKEHLYCVWTWLKGVWDYCAQKLYGCNNTEQPSDDGVNDESLLLSHLGMIVEDRDCVEFDHHSDNGLTYWLSRFSPCQITVEGRSFASAEEAFKAQEAPTVGAMTKVMLAKFQQNPVLQRRLLATGSAYLVEDSVDDFWGNGKDYKGQNKMGDVLMDVRHQLGGAEGQRLATYKPWNTRRSDADRPWLPFHPQDRLD
jgi:predicted NAD-dependent protein-ADP-ribosyltransferase YbiA (DUF1768 family)